jgi:aminopeptidase N
MPDSVKIFLGIIIIFIVSLCGYSQTKGIVGSTDYEMRLQSIRTCALNDDYYKCIEEVDDFHSSYPWMGYTWFMRAYAHMMLHDYYRASQDFSTSLSFEMNDQMKLTAKIMSDKQELANFVAGNFISNPDMDASTNYKPAVRPQDTLQGKLRPERTCFDIGFYDLTVKILPEERSIEGTNKIYFITTDTTSKIQIDLFENYDIHSMNLEGSELAYERIYNAIFIELDRQYLPGENLCLIIKYSGTPREAPQPPWNGGFVWKKNKKKHWVGVACEHLGASSWWPNKDHLSEKPDSMRISIQVPDGYQGIANGNLISTTMVDDNYVNFEWFVQYPINNYNVTFYMGDFVNFNEIFEGNSNSYRIDYYVLPRSLKDAREYYKQTQDIVRVYEKLFGEYPFREDGIAMVEAPYAGMEHQSAIAIGDDYGDTKRRDYDVGDYDYLVVHELAHEWWGNAVAIGDMADAWINEGFATYAECLFIEELFGHEEYLNAMASNMQIIFNLYPLVGRRDINENTFLSGDIYHKGAAFLHNLRCIINNDSLFFDIIKGIYQEYKFRITTTDDIINLVNDYTGRDYTAFFEKFLYDDEPPVLHYQFNIQDSTLNFKYKWIGVNPDFQMPFSVCINNDTCIKLTGTTSTKLLNLDGVSSFYLPNGNKFNRNIIPTNAFTYYWTYMDKNAKMFVYTDEIARGVGSLIKGLKEGDWIYYYPNRKIKREVTYEGGKLNEVSKSYDKNGGLSELCNYKNDLPEGEYTKFRKKVKVASGAYFEGVKTGLWSYYYPDGDLESQGFYENGVKTGIWKYYSNENILVSRINYTDGIPDYSGAIYSNHNGEPIESPDTLSWMNSPPSYKHDEADLYNFIQDNLIIPESVSEDSIKGTAYISFYVMPDGRIDNFEIVKTFSEDLSNNLIDALRKMQEWIPGYHGGNPVVAKVCIPYQYGF